MAVSYRLYWRRGRDPEGVFTAWFPRASEAVMRAFAARLRRGAWYRRINRRTGFSGREWAAAVKPGSKTGQGVLYGAYYVPYIRSRGTTGIRAVKGAWAAFDANGAVRKARVKP